MRDKRLTAARGRSSSRLRGWFNSLGAVQGDLPVMTAESRYHLVLRANPS